VSWPPTIGEPLPRNALVANVRYKLTTYSLNMHHSAGGPKARGFEEILSITLADVDHLIEAIETGVRTSPVKAVRGNAPYGILCEVQIPVRGLRTHAQRVVAVTTAWQLSGSAAIPRLVNAYIRG